jgi:hypothetical protein
MQIQVEWKPGLDHGRIAVEETQGPGGRHQVEKTLSDERVLRAFQQFPDTGIGQRPFQIDGCAGFVPARRAEP